MSDAGFFFPYQSDQLIQSLLNGLTLEGDSLSIDATSAGALWTSQFNSVEDYMANQVLVRLGPFTLDGAGAATVAHGIVGAFTVVAAQAWCKGASATEFAPATVSKVDATNLYVSAGGAGKACMASLVFSIVPPGW